jgi:matrixin
VTRTWVGSIVLALMVVGPGLQTPAPGPTTYFVSVGAPGTEYRPSDRQLAVWALEAWARNSGGALRFEGSDEARAQIRVYWAAGGDGQYGEMRRHVAGGRLVADVYVRPDTNALGPDIAELAAGDSLVRETIVYLTCLHELGHALGLEHTSDYRDIMYFFGYGGDIPGFFTRYRTQLRSRSDIASVAGLSTDDIAHLKALH